MMRTIYDYKNILELDKIIIKDELETGIIVTASASLAKALGNYYPRYSVIDIHDIINELIPEWDENTKDLHNYIVLRNAIENYAATHDLEGNILLSIQRNASDIWNAILLLMEADVYPQDIPDDVSTPLKHFKNIWMQLEKDNSVLMKLRAQFVYRLSDNKELLGKIELLIKRIVKKRIKDITRKRFFLIGFYFITPIQARILDIIEKAGINIAFLNCHDHNDPYSGEVWEKTFSKEYSTNQFNDVQPTVVNFFDDTKKYFVCGLPYQLSILEGLLSRDQILDEMSETDFNELAFIMEMGAMWFGDTGENLFKFDKFNARRKIKYCLLPLKFYSDKNKIPNINQGGERILSVDVALMNSTKKKNNDAAAIYINDLIRPDDTTYHSNFVYGETFEGLTTDALGIIVMRYFYEYKCTQLVLDTLGLGIGVHDFVCKDQYDSETGKTYKALKCCNDSDMAMRCKVKDANEVMWSVKADSNFNNQICVLLKNGIENGKISFLISEQECEEIISKELYKGYNKLTPADQALIKNSYLQTTFAEYELIKLEHEYKAGKIKVKEVSGMRKDRYSSIAYNYWLACQLELKLRPSDNTSDLLQKLAAQIKPSKLLKR